MYRIFTIVTLCLSISLLLFTSLSAEETPNTSGSKDAFDRVTRFSYFDDYAVAGTFWENGKNPVFLYTRRSKKLILNEGPFESDGYTFVYMSNDTDSDGVDEATKFVYLAIPTVFKDSVYQEAFYSDEDKEMYAISVLSQETVDKLFAIRSENIGWSINSSRCNLFGLSFHSAFGWKYSPFDKIDEGISCAKKQYKPLLRYLFSYWKQILRGRSWESTGIEYPYSRSRLFIAGLSNDYEINGLPDGNLIVTVAFIPFFGDDVYAYLGTWENDIYRLQIADERTFDALLAFCEKRLDFDKFADSADSVEIDGLVFSHFDTFTLYSQQELTKYFGDPLEYTFQSSATCILIQMRRSELGAKQLYWETGTYNPGKYFIIGDIGYDYKYLSNDTVIDGMNEADKMVLIAYPKEEKYGNKVFFMAEYNSSNRAGGLPFYTCSVERFDQIETLKNLTSADIDWTIDPGSVKPSRCDRQGIIFDRIKNAPRTPFETDEDVKQ